MKPARSPSIIVLAIIGVCFLLFGAWHLYQRKVAEDQTRTFFSSPPPKGLPDLSHEAPSPPQP